MSNHSTGKSASRAKPKMNQARSTVADKVALTRNVTSAAKQSPHWASATVLQGAVTAWNGTADAIAASDAAVRQLREQLKAAVRNLEIQTQQWGVEANHVLSNVDIICGGDREMIQSFGLQAVVRGSAQPVPVPTAITTSPGKLSGTGVIRWTLGGQKARHGFLLQRATDVANAATYSTPVACTKRRYVLTGASPASVVHVRIASVDPSSATGQSAWSDWVAVSVR
jgi:hypothetical protein